MADLLRAAVRGRISLLVSGGYGIGQDDDAECPVVLHPGNERLITIEDAAELQLAAASRRPPRNPPALGGGRGEIRQRELLKNALRMRPDRIILGECRGEEAFDMLQAMNTGHEGSMTTIHANTPPGRPVADRADGGDGGRQHSVPSIRGQIASGIQLVLQLQRMADGKRRVTSIAEITGMEGDIIHVQELYHFAREGVDEAGAIQGPLQGHGSAAPASGGTALAGRRHAGPRLRSADGPVTPRPPDTADERTVAHLSRRFRPRDAGAHQGQAGFAPISARSVGRMRG